MIKQLFPLIKLFKKLSHLQYITEMQLTRKAKRQRSTVTQTLIKKYVIHLLLLRAKLHTIKAKYAGELLH